MKESRITHNFWPRSWQEGWLSHPARQVDLNTWSLCSVCPQGFFLHPSHAKWQPVTIKRHAKIWPTRPKTNDVKIGRHMKGWTLCQKEKGHAQIWPTRPKTDDVKIGRHMKGLTLCQKKTLCVLSSFPLLNSDVFYKFPLKWSVNSLQSGTSTSFISNSTSSSVTTCRFSLIIDLNSATVEYSKPPPRDDAPHDVRNDTKSIMIVLGRH